MSRSTAEQLLPHRVEQNQWCPSNIIPDHFTKMIDLFRRRCAREIVALSRVNTPSILWNPRHIEWGRFRIADGRLGRSVLIAAGNSGRIAVSTRISDHVATFGAGTIAPVQTACLISFGRHELRGDRTEAENFTLAELLAWSHCPQSHRRDTP